MQATGTSRTSRAEQQQKVCLAGTGSLLGRVPGILLPGLELHLISHLASLLMSSLTTVYVFVNAGTQVLVGHALISC